MLGFDLGDQGSNPCSTSKMYVKNLRRQSVIGKVFMPLGVGLVGVITN